jgi:hypothetical protein
VRPTDEDQPGSRRPKLMSSSRRHSGEINILAMLEGRSGRPLAKRMPALPAALWNGSAGLLACALVGALAWLAREAEGPGRHGADTAAVAPVAPAPQAAGTPDAMTAAGFAGHVAADNAMAAHTIQDGPAPERPPAPSSRAAAQPRPRRPVVQPRAAAPAPDLDVALITAIIQHAARPGEAGQPGEPKGYDSPAKAEAQALGGASCADKSCVPALPDRPS